LPIKFLKNGGSFINVITRKQLLYLLMIYNDNVCLPPWQLISTTRPGKKFGNGYWFQPHVVAYIIMGAWWKE
jgi:hypothetical protein